jgi:hypothetical protein
MQGEGASAMSQRPGHTRTGPRARARVVAALLALCLLLASAAPVAADEYDPKRAGHPLRIVAYVLHPLGVLVDYLVMRPAYWIGSQEPLRTIFGQDDSR